MFKIHIYKLTPETQYQFISAKCTLDFDLKKKSKHPKIPDSVIKKWPVCLESKHTLKVNK